MFKSYFFIGVFTILWASFIIFLIMIQPKQGVQVINCSISEISPDFTPAMREACRKARSGLI